MTKRGIFTKRGKHNDVDLLHTDRKSFLIRGTVI